MEALAEKTSAADAVAGLEAFLMDAPQTECPVTHTFAPGVYLREIFMPADTIVVGHEHKTEHVNIVLSGRALVTIDGKTEEIVGGDTFVSKAGVQKALLIVEDMLWVTVHPTEETDLKKLENLLINKSEAYIEGHKATEEIYA